MIHNGIDIVKIDRFDKLKDNKKFMDNTFNINELKYIHSRNNDTATIAGLYAAKEAFLKALKKGIEFCPLKDIEISHSSNNAPSIIFHNDFDINNISLSISHDGEYAIAMVSFIK